VEKTKERANEIGLRGAKRHTSSTESTMSISIDAPSSTLATVH